LREDGERAAVDQVPAAVVGARSEDVSGTTQTDTHISSRRSGR
jgi:hypothetical protein